MSNGEKLSPGAPESANEAQSCLSEAVLAVAYQKGGEDLVRLLVDGATDVDQTDIFSRPATIDQLEERFPGSKDDVLQLLSDSTGHTASPHQQSRPEAIALSTSTTDAFLKGFSMPFTGIGSIITTFRKR